MAYKLIITDSFQRDLDDAIGYIALSLENRIAAAALLDDIEKIYDDLERMPMMYEASRDPYLRASGYRKAVVHNYIIVYKVDEETHTVSMMRFFHGRQDYEKLI